ncbi:MAG: hypothetical protein ABSA96_21545 [Candidatus Acidiferrales bacterium]
MGDAVAWDRPACVRLCSVAPGARLVRLLIALIATSRSRSLLVYVAELRGDLHGVAQHPASIRECDTV